MSIIRPASNAVALERFRGTVRAAITATPAHPQITPAQALIIVADILAERADSAIQSDLADRISGALAMWAVDWGLVDDADGDDWLGATSSVFTTVVTVN